MPSTTPLDNLHFPLGNRAIIRRFGSLADIARETLPLLSSGRIALSGGSTYARLLELWATEKPDCAKASFFPVDERMAPFDDAQSNWGAAFRLFLSRVRRAADREHWPSSLSEYERILRAGFPDWPPVFDAVFLGAGDDGHCAGLFTAEDCSQDAKIVVLQTKSPKPPHDRLTLSAATIAAAGVVVLVMSGPGKSGIWGKILAGNMQLPVVKILSRCRNAAVCVDSSSIA